MTLVHAPGSACRDLFNHAIEKIQCAGIIGMLSIALLDAPVVQAQTAAGVNLTPVMSLLLFEGCPTVTAATTVTGNQIISSQSDLDTLKGITRIEGFLSFGNVPSTLDFTPLDDLVEVTGNIAFTGSGLTNVSGFNCLASIDGDLIFFNNPALTGISGFSALTSIGGTLSFPTNNALTGISGFSALTSIGENLTFFSDDALTGISGFSALISIGGFLLIDSNNALTSISGFSALTSIGGVIRVIKNPLLDCTNPVPTFVPVTNSFGNAVNCDLVKHSASSNPSATIPDNNPTGVSDTITITGELGTIDQLTVDLDISHTYVNDLIVTLSNGTTTIGLVNKPLTSNGIKCSTNNIVVNLSDNPASLPDINSSCSTNTSAEAFPGTAYNPLQALSGFVGGMVNGTWTLKVTDTFGGDTGTLNSWGLNFTKNRL